MTREEEISQLALDLTPGDRPVFVADACGDDDALRLRWLKSGRHLEAEAMSRECVDAGRKHYPDEWARFHAESLFGGALLGQGKAAEAEPLLRSGYEGMSKQVGKLTARDLNRDFFRDAIERLVRFHVVTGDAKGQAGWREKLVAFDKKQRWTMSGRSW